MIRSTIFASLFAFVSTFTVVGCGYGPTSDDGHHHHQQGDEKDVPLTSSTGGNPAQADDSSASQDPKVNIDVNASTIQPAAFCLGPKPLCQWPDIAQCVCNGTRCSWHCP